MLIADEVNVPAAKIVCANLSDRAGGAWCAPPKGMIAIDPVLGRIQYAAGITLPKSLRVNYSYGFPAEIAGGPYDRSASLSIPAPAQTKLYAVIGTTAHPTLQSAVTAWNALAPGSVGVIVLPNFERYAIDLTGANALQLPAGSSLTILSGQPLAPPPSGPAPNPPDVIWNNSCVTLVGNIHVQAPVAKALAEGEPAPAGVLLLSGLWIAGQLTISGQNASIQIIDSTLVPGLGLTSDGKALSPGEPSIIITAAEAALSLLSSISGPIAADTGGSTRICSSIVDAISPCCAAYTASDLASAGADLQVQGSTILGKVHARTIPLASNTIFYARLGQRDPWPAAVTRVKPPPDRMRAVLLASLRLGTPQRYQCLPPDIESRPRLPQFHHRELRQAILRSAQRRRAHGRLAGLRQRLADRRLLPDSRARSRAQRTAARAGVSTRSVLKVESFSTHRLRWPKPSPRRATTDRTRSAPATTPSTKQPPSLESAVA